MIRSSYSDLGLFCFYASNHTNCSDQNLTNMGFFKHIYLITNYKTLLVTLLAILATWYCIEYELYADFPLGLVSIAIIFPVVFAINSAYARRERALIDLAQCKGFILGYYRIAMDQVKDKNTESSLVIREQIIRLFRTVKLFLESDIKKAKVHEDEVYKIVKQLSQSSRKLRDEGLAGRFVSRMSEHLTRFVVAFEDMKMIFFYRTPIGLRSYGKIFLYVFPVLYAPSFAHLAKGFSQDLPVFFNYMIPTIYAFILVSLDNVQTQLENPYDQIGEDDITVDLGQIEDMIEEGDSPLPLIEDKP
ncbi:MAG: putative membrane chloride channel (bestrophin family) [Paraglaciecola sp.]